MTASVAPSGLNCDRTASPAMKSGYAANPGFRNVCTAPFTNSGVTYCPVARRGPFGSRPLLFPCARTSARAAKVSNAARATAPSTSNFGDRFRICDSSLGLGSRDHDMEWRRSEPDWRVEARCDGKTIPPKRDRKVCVVDSYRTDGLEESPHNSQLPTSNSQKHEEHED